MRTILFLLLLCGPVFGQTSESKEPSAIGRFLDTLADQFIKIDSRLDRLEHTEPLNPATVCAVETDEQKRIAALERKVEELTKTIEKLQTVKAKPAQARVVNSVPARTQVKASSWYPNLSSR